MDKKILIRPISFLLAVIYSAILSLLLTGCSKEEPIRIGYVAGLTGTHSALGISGRNGVQFAVEEINRSGGINGRQIKLLTKDDKQDADTAVNVDRELINEGVVAIIGHMTSSMSVAAVPVVNEAKIVMLSPTTSTNTLTGIDDYFLRALAPTKPAIKRLASYAYKTIGIRKIIVAYDVTNKAFSKAWYTYFKADFQESGGGTVLPYPFIPGPDFSPSGFSEKIIREEPEGIVIVANPIDSAVIIQHIRKLNSRVPFLSSMWAMTDDFIQHGGHAAEGTVFVNWYHTGIETGTETQFSRAFKTRFGNRPNFANHLGYESAHILFAALIKNGDPAHLKETILDIGTFKGIEGDIVIDKFGDAKREVFLMTVKNGQFIRLEK